MTVPDGSHLEDLSLNQFDAVVLGEDTRIREGMVLGNRKKPLDRFCHDASAPGILTPRRDKG
jgi:hypothetical protein